MSHYIITIFMLLPERDSGIAVKPYYITILSCLQNGQRHRIIKNTTSSAV